MGLDIALGVVILLAGLRGWFRGLAMQVVQLGSLIACVYLAGPVRDLARPYGREYLAGIQPEVLDKLLWWTGAVVSYVVATGIGYGFIRIHRRRTYAEFEPNRGDQGAGFFLGALKGALVAVFVASGIQGYVPEYVKAGGWIADQVQTSKALEISARYRPAEQVWKAKPVQAFVAHVRREGLGDSSIAAETGDSKPKDPTTVDAQAAGSGASPDPENRAQPGPVAAARRLLRPLKVPSPRPLSRLDPRAPSFLPDLDSALEVEGLRRRN